MACLRSIGCGMWLLGVLASTGAHAQPQGPTAGPSYPPISPLADPEARQPHPPPEGPAQSAGVYSEYAPPQAPAAIPARRRGTHFFLEGQLGVANSPPGPTVGLLLGAGGKLPRSPFRFYFLTELAASQRGGPGSEGGGQTVWLGAGVRSYLPVAPRLRLLADMTGGVAYLRDELIAHRDGLTLARYRPQLSLAAGVQLRLSRQLSVGTRAAYMIVGNDEPQSPLAERWGWTFTGSATWHF